MTMVLLLRDDREPRLDLPCRRRCCSAHHLPLLRRSLVRHRNAANRCALETALDIPEVELYPIFQTQFASAMLPPGTSSRRNEVCSTLLADDFSEWNPSLPVELLEL